MDSAGLELQIKSLCRRPVFSSSWVSFADLPEQSFMALVSTDQGCQDSGHLFLLIIWKKCKLKQQAIFLVYRIGKYLKWRYYAVLMRVRGIGELVVLVGVQISSIILRSDLTSCSKSWRKEPGGIPLLRISPNRIILGMLKDLSICIFIGTLFNKRKIRKKRNAQ